MELETKKTDRSFGARNETRNLIDGEITSDSDDDFFLNGPTRPVPDKYPRPQDVKLKTVRDKVNDVTKVMFTNCEKLIARGDNLEMLAERSQELDEASRRFKASSDRLKRKTWWQNTKFMAISGGILFFIVIIIIIVSFN